MVYLILGAVIGAVIVAAFLTLVIFFGILFGGEFALGRLNLGRSSRFLLIALKNLRRNYLRTSLTYVVVFVAVVVVTLIWSILFFLYFDVLGEKSNNFKAIVTERWQIPSQMPLSYVEPLSRGAAKEAGDARPDDFMTWQFYGGTLDPDKRTRENLIFFFCMDPAKLPTMMDDLENIDPELVRRMQRNKQGILVGRERLESINKKVGERIKVTSLNYKGIDLELEIVGQLPEGRYNQSAVLRWDYLNDSLQTYRDPKTGAMHPQYDKSLTLMWLRVPDAKTFERITGQIESSSEFGRPAVKCETGSSGISAWLDSYRDLLWGMMWLMTPAVVISMTLVVAVVVSISVRERRTEMAVLKVMGYRPWQIMALILGEAVLVGGLSGLVSASLTYTLINGLGGFKFPIAFFPAFFISKWMLVLGPALGALAAVLGGLVPAWSARSIKVSDVFAKVA